MVAERYTYRRYGTAWIKFVIGRHEYDAQWDTKGAVTVTDANDQRVPDNHPAVTEALKYKREMDKALERSMRPL